MSPLKLMTLVVCLGLSSHGMIVMAADAQAIGAACAEQFPRGTAEQIQNCFMSKLRSEAPVAKPAPRIGGLMPAKFLHKSPASSQGNTAAKSNSAGSDDIDPTKGCPYLVETSYGLTHKEGTRLCVGKRSLSCDMTGKNDDGKFEYDWHTVSEQGCISGFEKASTYEARNTVHAKALKKMNEPGE
jgi:hypothetical protein